MNRLPTSPHGDPDRSLRHLQRQADAALSPATLARLRQARHQATHGAPAPRLRHRGWWLATACSAVLAVTVAVQFHRSAPPLPADVAADANQALADDALLFDESPEMYLWLGSDALAME
ncbi:hypothetical protein [Stenotrophomonas mori]|uniref:DUF3379 domain-containing protein n=1 Tax=Stenotrophomonas mori TaxID=2871096 RepID=A0ABT0SK03_9GAMM|nr:hypothetical protein [Stenotrophomonas mori]MCL7715668.1 hypothetical protein [Stenotrophomonas mori]